MAGVDLEMGGPSKVEVDPRFIIRVTLVVVILVIVAAKTDPVSLASKPCCSAVVVKYV